MDAITIVLIVLLVACVAVAIVAVAMTRRRDNLRERFGPEYERVMASAEDHRAAEAELRGRVEARERLDIRPLPETKRDAYAQQWRDVQAEFVDRPGPALLAADELVARVMADRGYPVDDFDRQADLISVDHPEVVANFRAAHGVYARSGGDVSTETMRHALVSYRALFAELLEVHDVGAERQPEEAR